MANRCPDCGFEGDALKEDDFYDFYEAWVKWRCPECGCIWKNKYDIEFSEKEILKEGEEAE